MEATVNLVNLSFQDGVEWAKVGVAEPDILIYCSDGVLAANQVQLAVASDWLKQLLQEAAEFDESRIKTILLPFVNRKQMQQVLELICSGSVILEEADISSLVEVSSIIGCIGDMLKEPHQQILGDIHKSEESLSQSQGLSLEKALMEEKSIKGVLESIHQIQAERMKRMEIEEEKSKDKTSSFTTVVKAKREMEDEIDSDNFVVSDDEFDEEDAPYRREYRSSRAKKKRKIRFDIEEFEGALIELGESLSARGGAGVQCGLCNKVVGVPEDNKVRTRIQFFKKNHFIRCQKKKTGGTEARSEPNTTNQEGAEDEDHLLEVYKFHCERKEVDNGRTAQGRRKAEVPPLEKIKSFLTALGGATIINKGHQIKCGLCENKLRVNIDRTIMGNIRYFERTHLVRCPVRIAQTGKPTELISESFLPGRTPPTRVLKSISVFDNDRAEVVARLMVDKDVDFRRAPGRPRKDEEQPDPGQKTKREYYISKRKQCLSAATICFNCQLVFDSGPEAEEHFANEHPEIEKPFYCLACQEYCKTHDEILEHLDVEHNYKQVYSCPFCDEDAFDTQSKLSRHIVENHPNDEQLFTCTMCTKGFISFHSLKSHMKTHSNIGPEMMVDPKSMLTSMQGAFDCKFCGLNIMFGKHLDEHIRTEHADRLEAGEKAYTCKHCNTHSSTSHFDEFYHFEQHLRDHGITIDNICRFCHKANFNRNKFVEHFKQEHPGQHPFECPRYGCDKTFLKKQKQQDHLVLHKVKEGDISEDMKKLCVECGKVFYVRKKLEQHVKLVHGGLGLPPENTNNTKEAKKCHLCPKTFSNNALLQGHIRKHENNPCFMCDHCGKGFYRKDRLAVHTRSVHLGQKNFQCDVCEKKFIDSYKLRRHMKTHTSGRGAAIVAAAATATPAPGGVSIVTVPVAVSYETIDGETIVRKEDLIETEEGQHVTIQQIGSQPTILQVVSTQPHHIAKRSTIQNFLKFEGEEVVAGDQSPVDFTQQPDTKIHTQYILNTQMYQT